MLIWNTNYDLSGDLGISAASNTGQLILDKIQDDDYREMVQKLNKEQKEVIVYVLSKLLISHSTLSFVIEGRVGKSHLSKPLYKTRTGNNSKNSKNCLRQLAKQLSTLKET